MPSITNTAEVGFNQSWLFGGNPGAIGRQEAKGQQELVNSEVLPTDCNSWPKLRELGVVTSGSVAGDDMFMHVTLPPGRTKKATDHSMWSELLNEKGEVVADIFYKAAFYDRSAHMSVK